VTDPCSVRLRSTDAGPADRSGVPSSLEVVSLIPTMILFGLVTAYWWKLALPAAAVIWPVLLLASDTITATQIPAAALLGLVNGAVGAALVQGVLVTVRGRHRASHAARASRA
jgi:sulfite exporter TauE/SafE